VTGGYSVTAILSVRVPASTPSPRSTGMDAGPLNRSQGGIYMYLSGLSDIKDHGGGSTYRVEGISPALQLRAPGSPRAAAADPGYPS
jgi:hypothetical protein